MVTVVITIIIIILAGWQEPSSLAVTPANSSQRQADFPRCLKNYERTQTHPVYFINQASQKPSFSFISPADWFLSFSILQRLRSLLQNLEREKKKGQHLYPNCGRMASKFYVQRGPFHYTMCFTEDLGRRYLLINENWPGLHPFSTSYAMLCPWIGTSERPLRSKLTLLLHSSISGFWQAAHLAVTIKAKTCWHLCLSPPHDGFGQSHH